MKDYSFETYGTMTVVTSNSSGATFAISPAVASVVAMTQVSSRNGDHVSPNIQSYRKVKKRNLTGFYNTSQYTGAYTPPTKVEKSGIVDTGWVPGTEEFTYSSNAYNSALESLQEQLRGSVDLSIDLLQLPESKKMVQSWVKGANHLVTTIRKIKQMPLKAAADAYLQWTYGVAPTMGTLFGAMSNFADASTHPRAVKGRGKEILTYENSFRTGAGRAGTVRVVVSKRCEIGTTYTPDGKWSSNVSNYTSLNPASIVYEMIPFSFVVDWFYNVGGWIRSCESAYLLSPFMNRTYVTQTIRGTGAASCSGGTTVVNTTYNWRMLGTTEFSQKTRSVGVNLLLPRAPTLPSFGNLENTSMRRALNGLALSRSPAKELSNKIHKYLGVQSTRGFLD